MCVKSRQFAKCFLIVLVMGLLASCGGKEERKAKYLERGKAYFEEQNHDKAAIEFKNVLQIDPKTAEAYLYLGEISEKKQDWSKAFGNYMKASELDPELLGARVHLAKLYLAQASALRAQDNQDAAANAMGLAQDQINEILSREPDDLEGITLQATLWITDGDMDKAKKQLEGVVELEPGLQSAAVLLSNIYDREGRKDDAESVLTRAVELNDDSVILKVRLSQFYRKYKQSDKVEEILKKIIDKDPDELSHRVSLASFFSQTDQIDEAEEVLRDAIAADPEDDQRYLLLAEFLATKRSKGEAITELKKFIQQKPDVSELRFGLIKLYLASDRQDDAKKILNGIIEQEGLEPAGLKARVMLAQIVAVEHQDSERASMLIDEVLKENPRDNDALLLHGRLAAQQKDYIEAINSFRSVLKDQPNSLEVLQLLAAAHLANNEKELARDTLVRAINSNPREVKARISMARLLAQDKDFDGAFAQLDEVLKHDQYQEQALIMKYELYSRNGNAAGMEEVARSMQTGAPDKVEGFVLEARLRLAQKEYDAARDVLDKALAKNPESSAALMAMSDVLAAQGKYAEAATVAEKLQKILPNNAEGYYRKARLLQEQGNLSEAIEQYEVALQNAPESIEVLTALINLEAKHRGADKAEQRLLAILENNEEHGSASELLGAVYLSEKKYAAAEKAFERQIEINPVSVTAYSKLAITRSAQDNLDGAVRGLEQGLQALPGNVRLIIALAGVRERQKNYEAAISLYEKVLAQQPDNAVSINNLAALLSDHRTDAASMEKAAELAAKLEKTSQPAFVDTAGWVYYRKGDYEKAAKILKGVVEKAPQVPVFQYHLGMAYFKLGDKSAASEHLSKATDGEFRYEGVEEARATLKSL